MFFIILLSLSILGLIVVYILIQKKSPRKLLQYIQKSCIIDSIRFEKRFLYTVFYIKKHVLRIILKIKKIHSLYSLWAQRHFLRIKQFIRRKLYHPKEHSEVSEFISELKK